MARKIRKLKQESVVANQVKSNPNHFWKYIKSRISTSMSVGELKTMDATGREVRCTEDADKANLLADFYFSIYTEEIDEGPEFPTRFIMNVKI